MRSRLVVLVSGNGSNLQALLDASLPVVAVVADRPCRALDRARSAGVDAVVVAELARLGDVVSSYEPDWVVLAGFLRLLKQPFLDRFRVVNLHPALPGELPGLHAIERAINEARRGTRTRSGVMVHLVPDEGVDTGPALATADVPMDPLETFEQRMHATEHDLLVRTLQDLLSEVSHER
jgi:phosphoribosylglycinamide formyltransferase 1